MTRGAPLDPDLELMRASMLLDSDASAAARRAGAILAGSPGHAEARLLLAAACRKLGDPAAAAAALESLDTEYRDTAFMQLEIGLAYAAAGRTPAATAAFRRAVEIDAGLADGWRELAAALFAAGDTRAADLAYLRYNRLKPDPSELQDAIVALAGNRLDAAEHLLQRRLTEAPLDVEALRLLAQIERCREDFAGAERRLRRCLELAPGHAAARFELAQLLYSQHRNAEALPLLDRLLEAQPRHIDFLSLRAQALRLVGRNDEAVALMAAVVAEHPHEGGAWITYGHLLREIGEGSRAVEMYRRALAVQPGSGRAYWSLANLKTFRFDDADLSAMQNRLDQKDLSGTDATHLEFALGKAFEDAGRFGASFEHYARGNARQRAAIAYDPESLTAIVRRSISVFTPAFFADRAGWGSAARAPIFIVGAPRCGSTLVEQILASHTAVEGTGELTIVPTLALELTARLNPEENRGYPGPVALLQRPEVEALAARYLEEARTSRTSARPRFVDKMLSNFAHIGLIQLMFPQASIVDVRRHPLGCGFSCYKQLFARNLGFTYDLKELGRYLRDYAALMAHIDTALPGRVHRVMYEDLVADPHTEVRRLLDHCRLPFEPQCLQFHENRRVVQTISSEQVRRPLYAESVDQWVNYEPWLGELKDALHEGPYAIGESRSGAKKSPP